MSFDLSRAVDIARLSLRFSRVERATCHEDGVRPETDSDHTVMLQLLTLYFCPEELDVGLAVQFALVHDLVEAYAGDAQTLTIDAQGKADKAAREAAALARLRDEFIGSGMTKLIRLYEQQKLPEARVVRILDKVAPKLTHLLNGCAAAKVLVDQKGFEAAHARQYGELREQYPEPHFDYLFVLLREAMYASEEAWATNVA